MSIELVAVRAVFSGWFGEGISQLLGIQQKEWMVGPDNNIRARSQKRAKLQDKDR